LWRMAEHRAGIAEAEVGALVAVDVLDLRAFGLLDDEGERHRPVLHPVHRHATEITCRSLADQCLRLRARRCINLRLALPEGGDAGAADAADGPSHVVHAISSKRLQVPSLAAKEPQPPSTNKVDAIRRRFGN